MGERGRLLREGKWVMAGRLTAIAGGLLGIRLLTEVVDPAVFGVVALLLGVMTLGQNLLCSPMIHAAQRFYADVGRGSGLGPLRFALDRSLMRATGLLVLLMFGVALVFSSGGAERLQLAAVLGALAVVEVWKTAEFGLLGAARRQRPLAIWQGLEAWAMPITAAALAWAWGASALSVFAGYLAASGALLAGVLLLRVKRVGAAEKSACDRAEAARLGRAMRRFALPFVPMAVLGWVTALGDRYVVGTLVGLREVGIYAACYGVVSRPFLMVHGALAQTLRPLYFQTVAARDHSRERKVFRAWAGGTAVTCVVGVVGFIFLGDLVARILLAKQFRSGVSLMPWLAAGQGALVASHLFESKLFAYKRTAAVLLAQVISAVVAAATMVPLALYLGLAGVAIACPVYFSVQALITAFLSRGGWNAAQESADTGAAPAAPGGAGRQVRLPGGLSGARPGNA